MIKAALKKIVSLFGLEIRKSDTARKKIGDYTYEAIRPWARYAPWWDDDDFLDLYRQIKAHTLVDIYRCWELWDLMSQASHLPGDV